MGTKREIPLYIQDFLNNSFLHTACIHSDQMMEGGMYGYVWRVYPFNLGWTRQSFRSHVEQLCAWAREHKARAKVLLVSYVGGFSMLRRGDYIVFTISDPVATRLEDEGLLPSQPHGKPGPCAKITQVV